MSSANKTENFELNLWSETDRPQRNDFNSDNIIIDRVLQEHISDSDMHLTEKEKARAQNPISVFPYLGDGNEYKDLSIAFDARAVFVYRASVPMNSYDSTIGKNVVNGGFAFFGADGTQGVKLMSPNIARVYQGESEDGKVKLCLNEVGVQYKLAVFR